MPNQAARHHGHHHDHNKEISIEYFEELLIPYFGEYEAMRIVKYFRQIDYDTISFSEAVQGVKGFVDEDLDEIIAQSFDKLDLDVIVESQAVSGHST